MYGSGKLTMLSMRLTGFVGSILPEMMPLVSVNLGFLQVFANDKFHKAHFS